MTVRHAAQGLLGRALGRCRRDHGTGALRVVGGPGGVFHLVRGEVVAVESPGAPGVGTLLLRSGRVDEADWVAAQDAGSGAGGWWTAAALIGQGCLGAAGFEVVCRMAAQDAAFAVVAGQLDDCSFQPALLGESPYALPPFVGKAIDPEWLLEDARRRLAALAALPTAVSPDRERVRAVNADEFPEGSVLSCADGRRTARDIAFALGRGVYGVTVEVSRLLAEGLVEIAEPRTVPVAPDPAEDFGVRAPAAPTPAPAPAADSVPAGEVLPKRVPGTNWRGMLRPRGRGRTAEQEKQ
jgi:hypothetical protein